MEQVVYSVRAFKGAARPIKNVKITLPQKVYRVRNYRGTQRGTGKSETLAENDEFDFGKLSL
jgi:hypothetical protein